MRSALVCLLPPGADIWHPAGRREQAAQVAAAPLVGEDPWPAGLRELYEETNIRSVERLGEIADWLSYDLPRDIVGQAWGGRYRGQTQKWYALRFTGNDREIDIATPGGGAHKPEFIAWRWEPMGRRAVQTAAL
jgi:8-oxo-dGTP pyrophosphatase MutT (NUDIX family)